MLYNLVFISLSISVPIAAALLLTPLWAKKFSAKGKYILWLILAVRLLIPFQVTLPNAPFTVTLPPALERQSPFSAEFQAANGTVTDDLPSGEEGQISHKPSLTLETLLEWIWLGGVLVILLVTFGNYLAFWRTVRPKLVPCQAQCRLPVYHCESITSPMLAGFFKPKILLPQIDYTSEELALILEHEMAHYKKGDLWYKLVLLAANALHWFNPLVYLMTRQATRDLEASCDERIVKGRDLDFRKRYAMTILKSIRQGTSAYLSTSLTQDARQVKKRFQSILDTKTKRTGVAGIAVIVVAAVLLSACFSPSPPTFAYSFEQLSPLLGQSRDEVFASLGLTVTDGEETEHGQSADFLLRAPVAIGQRQYQLRLGFYNGQLIQFDYYTDSAEAAYAYANEILTQIQKTYGEPTTYPTLPNRLTKASQVPSSGTELYEQWDARLSETAVAAFGHPNQKFNLILKLSVYEAGSRLTVGYTLNPNASQ